MSASHRWKTGNIGRMERGFWCRGGGIHNPIPNGCFCMILQEILSAKSAVVCEKISAAERIRNLFTSYSLWFPVSFSNNGDTARSGDVTVWCKNRLSSQWSCWRNFYGGARRSKYMTVIKVTWSVCYGNRWSKFRCWNDKFILSCTIRFQTVQFRFLYFRGLSWE